MGFQYCMAVSKGIIYNYVCAHTLITYVETLSLKSDEESDTQQ